ncbi:MAG: PEP-CTERM sorting domain-containing protein [Phycisphaerales bacterium]|nr:PEP-CTERM sorting domain-containing protein [Phycisphaerales bacterium]
MYRRTKLLSTTLAVLLIGPSMTTAAIIYDEAVDGDLSGDRLAPTTRTLSIGSNTLAATSVSGDLEYVTLTVPPSFQLDAIILDSYVSPNVQSFAAVQNGTVFTESPASPNPANLLGYSHFGTGPGQVGTDILDDISTGAGAIGFSPPLPSGDYTFWLQETGPSPAAYTLDFVVTPEPATTVMLGFAGLWLLRRRN